MDSGSVSEDESSNLPSRRRYKAVLAIAGDNELCIHLLCHARTTSAANVGCIQFVL